MVLAAYSHDCCVQIHGVLTLGKAHPLAAQAKVKRGMPGSSLGMRAFEGHAKHTLEKHRGNEIHDPSQCVLYQSQF